MKTLIIISILIALIIIVLKSVCRSPKWDFFFNSIIAIVTTFIGVYIGLYYSEVGARAEKRDKAKRMIEMSIKGLIFYDREMSSLLGTWRQDTTKISLAKLSEINFKRIEAPFNIPSFLASEFVMTNFSQETIFQLRTNSRNLDITIESMRRAISDNKESAYISRTYNEIKFMANEMIRNFQLEDQYQNGDITLEELDVQVTRNLETLPQRMSTK